MLTGQTVLIVEGEFLIALDIQRILESLRAEQTLFARNAKEALEAAERWPRFGLALVEVHHDQHDDIALVKSLDGAGVKVVLMSADVVLRRRPNGLPAVPLLIKPFSEEELTSAIGAALAN